MVPVSYQSIITISTLIPTSSIAISIYHQLIPISDNKFLLFQAQLLFCILYIEFMALFIRLFKDIWNILIYETFFIIDNLNNN